MTSLAPTPPAFEAALDLIDTALAENSAVVLEAMALLPPELPGTPEGLLAYALEGQAT